MLLARGDELTAAREEDADIRGGRGWAWAALVTAVLVVLAGLPTFGLSVLAAPLPALLTGVAAWRSPHDAVFWIALALSAVSLVGLLGLVVSALAGPSW